MAYNEDVQLSQEYQDAVAREVEARFRDLAEKSGIQMPQQQPQQTAQGGPIKVKLWGSEQEFKSQEEIQDFLERYMTEATNVAQNTAQTAVPQQQAAAPPPPKVDVERYVELMAKDPYAAEKYKNLQIYGVEEPVLMLAREVASLKQGHQQVTLDTVANRFKAMTPDFPADDPQAGIALAQTMQRIGLPATPEGMQAGWHHVVASGAYRGQQRPQEQPSGGNSWDNSTVTTRAIDTSGGDRTGIPHLGGGVSSSYNPVLDRFEQLPADQMRIALENLQRGGQLG